MGYRLINRLLTGGVMLPVVIVIFCIFAFWMTMQFDRVPPILKRGIQPSDFPQLVIVLIVLLSIVVVFTDKSDVPKKLPTVVWKTLATMAGFAMVAWVDLFLGLSAFAVTLALLWGERRTQVLIGLGVMPLVVFFVFDLVFEIRFPRGLLTSLWYEWT